MGTHRFESFPHLPPARRALLRHETVREDAHDVRICFSGEIDLSTSDMIEVAVTDALHSHAPRQLYVDMAEVRFIDASGIGALMRCRERAVDAGCLFAVTNAQPIAYRVLEVTGLLHTLSVTPAAAKPDRCPTRQYGSAAGGSRDGWR